MYVIVRIVVRLCLSSWGWWRRNWTSGRGRRRSPYFPVSHERRGNTKSGTGLSWLVFRVQRSLGGSRRWWRAWIR